MIGRDGVELGRRRMAPLRELVLVVAGADHPGARRERPGPRLHRAQDVVDALDGRRGQRHVRQAHAEGRHVVVGVMEPGHHGAPLEAHHARGVEVPAQLPAFTDGDDAPAEHGQRGGARPRGIHGQDDAVLEDPVDAHGDMIAGNDGPRSSENATVRGRAHSARHPVPCICNGPGEWNAPCVYVRRWCGHPQERWFDPMRRSPGSLFGGVLGVLILVGVAVLPVHAGPVFNVDLTFADGRTATGSFKIADFCCSHYPTELFLESADITTTGPEGYHYVQGNGDPSPQFFVDNLYLTFNRTDYFGFLVFNFNAPFDVDGREFAELRGLVRMRGRVPVGRPHRQHLRARDDRALRGGRGPDPGAPRDGNRAGAGVPRAAGGREPARRAGASPAAGLAAPAEPLHASRGRSPSTMIRQSTRLWLRS